MKKINIQPKVIAENEIKNKKVLHKKVIIIKTTQEKKLKSMDEVCKKSDEIKKQNTLLASYRHKNFDY